MAPTSNPPQQQLSDDDYAIASVCGTPGTLHIYTSRDNVPRHVHTACHVRRPTCAAMSPTTLYALSQSTNTSHPSLTTHTLSRPSSTITTPTTTSATAPSSSTATGLRLTAVTLSNSNALFAAASATGTVHIWRTTTGHHLTSFQPHLHSISALTFTDDDDSLLTASADATITLHPLLPLVDAHRNPSTPQPPLLTLTGHTLPATTLSVGFAGVTARLLSTSPDRTLRIWHIATGTPLATILLPAHAATISTSRDESLTVLPLSDGTIALLQPHKIPTPSTTSLQARQCIPRPATALAARLEATAAALSPSATRVVAGYSDGVVRVYDVATRALLHSYSKHSTTAPVTFVATMPSLPPPPTIARPTQSSTNVVMPPPPLARPPPDNHLEQRAATRQQQKQNKQPSPTSPQCSENVVSLDLSHADSLHDVAWRLVDDAADVAFARPHEVLEALQPAAKASKSNMGLRRDVVMDELVREVNYLRKVNAELEAAGKQLISLVQSSFE